MLCMYTLNTHQCTRAPTNENSMLFLAKKKTNSVKDGQFRTLHAQFYDRLQNSRNPNEHTPVDTSSSSKLLHSWRNRLAPVKLPSPPMHTRFVMPLSNKFNAARRRPSRSRKSLQRALPITVPPFKYTTTTTTTTPTTSHFYLSALV